MSAESSTIATTQAVESLQSEPSSQLLRASEQGEPSPQPAPQPAPPPTDDSDCIPPQPMRPALSSPRSRSASRSPEASRSGTKRRSTFSPVPEEEPSLPPSARPSTLHPTPSADEPASKKSRSAASSSSRSRADPDAKRRGQRMFGVLTSTLSQFKRESESTHAASAAQKRAEIQARLATKLRESQQAIAHAQRRSALLWDARRLAEQIVAGDVQRKTLRSMKRRMASFLYTPSPTNPGRPTHRDERLAPQIPLSVPPMAKSHASDPDFAVYFLPGKTLPEQEDTLNEQEDDVDEQIDRFDDAWEAKRSDLVEKLDRLKARIRDL